MNKITEQESLHSALESQNIETLLRGINKEDQKVANAVALVIPSITALVEQIILRMKLGGRLFYMGAGTSGRLGVVDASECPPTFGVSDDVVIGIIAGGDSAIRKAVEFAEDDTQQGFKDLQAYQITPNDTVIGIAASGSTPYVIGALQQARKMGVLTGCITNNPNSSITKAAEYAIEVNVGPEFVTGSTRMKSGTSQKLVLNMISTTLMIQLGRVKGNRMVDMQLSNNKLVDRGTLMVQKELKINYDQAEKLLLKYGSVRDAVDSQKQ